MASKWLKIGSIIKNKDPKKSSYLKVEENVSLKKGQFLNVINPRKREGISDEELAKIPDWKIADLGFFPEE